jgi:hypothetical protein
LAGRDVGRFGGGACRAGHIVFSSISWDGFYNLMYVHSSAVYISYIIYIIIIILICDLIKVTISKILKLLKK